MIDSSHTQLDDQPETKEHCSVLPASLTCAQLKVLTNGLGSAASRHMSFEDEAIRPKKAQVKAPSRAGSA